MAITFGLVHSAPDRLLYLCYQDGRTSSPPVAADGFATLPNDGGATPDLRTDSLAVGAIGGLNGIGWIPIDQILRVRLNGWCSIAAGAITQAQARALFLSEDIAGATLLSALFGRCVTRITATTAAIRWAVDWNVDAQGDPVCEVRSATGTAGYAILDIQYRHSYKL